MTDLLFLGVATVFLAASLSALFHMHWARRLPALSDLPAPAHPVPVRCSVILAARDEEARVADTIRHLLALTGLRLEVIAVDDRSTDRTREILDGLAAEDARVRVRRVDTLPAGWLGKCHACHLGAALATGDWLLFTDADCWLKPDVVERALRLAARDRADHVTLTPGVAPGKLTTQAWHLAFLVSLANWFSGVNRDQPKAYLGMGAFNLIRAATSRECGGYEALRMTVVDDVKLGLLVRRAGKRTRAFIGGDDAECRWGTTARAMVRLMEKNYFAALDYRTGLATAGALGGALLVGVAAFGPFAGTGPGVAAAAAWTSMALPACVCARRLGWGWGGAALAPLMYPVLVYAMANSAWKTLRQGGVRWRGTFYPLEQLRVGNVR